MKSAKRPDLRITAKAWAQVRIRPTISTDLLRAIFFPEAELHLGQIMAQNPMTI